MADALVSSRQLAESMSRPANGASAAYLAARTDLLQAEIDQRRLMEKVAALRRALPAGPVAHDYVFRGRREDGRTGDVRLSELFRDGPGSLVVYCYMFPRHEADERPPAKAGEIATLPLLEQPCPSCTALLDQLDAAAPHFEAGGGRLAVVANTDIDNLFAVARDRGWRNLRLLSSKGTTFKRDFDAEDEEGQQIPRTLVFERDGDGQVRLFWASSMVWTTSDPGEDHRDQGTIEPFWTMFDLTREGRPDFSEQLQYECCGSDASQSDDPVR
jgi:predicted dithiol-disulfide oxidoreductase (DUF899 family)